MSALRMDIGFVGLPLPSLLCDESELFGMDLEKMGFKFLSDKREQVPWIDTFGVDLSSKYDLDFMRQTSFGQHVRSGGYTFSDPHSEQWWQGVHSTGSLVLLVTPDPGAFTRVATIGQGVDNLIAAGTLVGRVGLAIFAYRSGVGTHPAP